MMEEEKMEEEEKMDEMMEEEKKDDMEAAMEWSNSSIIELLTINHQPIWVNYYQDRKSYASIHQE